MHNEHQGEAEQIARRLSAAQKRLLQWPNPEWACAWNQQAADAAERKGIAIRHRGCGNAMRLTPLGMAVRTLLESEES